MATPWAMNWKVREMASLVWDKLSGRISQAELEQGVRNLVGPEPELPLGIGSITELPKCGK